MASGSFSFGRTSMSPANDFPSYTLLEALEEVEVTPAEAYCLGLPMQNIEESIIDNGRGVALGGFTGSNSQLSRAAYTRSHSPSYGLIHSSYSNIHLMSAYPRSVPIQNSNPAVGMYYAINSTSPYAWSSTGYGSWSLSGDVGFGNANPGYVHEAATNIARTFVGSSYENYYALQPAIYSNFRNNQLQPANYSVSFNQELQPAVPTPVGHGSQVFGPNIRAFPYIPFVYDSQFPNGTTLIDPLVSIFEQDLRQHTNTILCNAFEQPPAIAQGSNCPVQAGNPRQGSHYLVASASPLPSVVDANGYLSEFKDLDSFPQELMESQDSSPSLYDANMGMDEYFESGDYLLDDIDGFDSAEPSELFID